MEYKEIQRDLFAMPADYTFVHCISSDFALGAGIAKVFEQKYNLREKLRTSLPDYVNYWDTMNTKGICIRTGNVLNLVTKRNYWDKPTYETMRAALLSMKQCCKHFDIKKIACPLIGCGLDKLEWREVSAMIQDVFSDTNMEIVICRK